MANKYESCRRRQSLLKHRFPNSVSSMHRRKLAAVACDLVSPFIVPCAVHTPSQVAGGATTAQPLLLSNLLSPIDRLRHTKHRPTEGTRNQRKTPEHGCSPPNLPPFVSLPVRLTTSACTRTSLCREAFSRLHSCFWIH